MAGGCPPEPSVRHQPRHPHTERCRVSHPAGKFPVCAGFLIPCSRRLIIDQLQVPHLREQRCSLRARAATLERETVAVPFQQEAGQGIGFYTGQDGYLYCDNLRVEDARHQVCARMLRPVIQPDARLTLWLAYLAPKHMHARLVLLPCAHTASIIGLV